MTTTVQPPRRSIFRSIGARVEAPPSTFFSVPSTAPFMALWVALGLTAACGEDTPILRPFIEMPAESSAAYPLEGLEELELSIAREGDSAPLVFVSASVDQPLSLDNVPFGDNLVVHLSGIAAGVEVAYGRTCPIQVTAEFPVIAPRLYFSRIVRWGTLDQRARVPDRTGGYGFAMDSGQAVILGGDTQVIEVFDPVVTGSFAELETQTMPRQQATLTPFTDDSALILGGTDEDGDAIASFGFLSPNAETLGRQLELYPDGPAIVDHAVALLVDGSIVATGGKTQSEPGNPFTTNSQAWRFRVAPGRVIDGPLPIADPMQIPRSEHTMTRLNNDFGAAVLIAGGRDDSDAPVAQAEFYNPLGDTFELVDSAVLNVPRWGHQAVLMPGNVVLILGGYSLAPDTEDVQPEPTIELYNPVRGVFDVAGQLSASAGVNDFALTPLPDGRVLLSGGRNAAGELVDTVNVARLDSINGRVDISGTQSLATPRANHTAVALCDGTVLVTGGTSGSGDDASPAERYNPPVDGRRAY